MTVIVVAACPVGLRGHLTRWLLEISPGVFVGKPTKRVRDLMWVRVVEMVKNGRAIMVHTANNEQGLDFRVHDHDWIPTDFEGVNLMLRPHKDGESGTPSGTAGQRKTGWSAAGRRRRYGR
ncbi:type I-E CRISPR-associated endoribonuclease Cas2e [Amycolatopsis cynarae]|uniref:Type I-E CRISPR-associated endoribonuclease Cas2e n=1 Tax=Amycolatopsis cynarae TaxID=2995223 RepID=A0ABY7B587_9PSEU|nr:type I-E CRISPR-associated endoribonuclease Cas2e [Amycolatopsis sp. HUAS 11-8]WAL65963.1 type I-E CRISPR-associated endoribonuclease Cas2e [Amycolatopsis sp. HUAS 11-8]